MDKFKDLLLSVFGRAVKGSIKIGREEYKEYGTEFTDFSIKFTRVNTADDKTYEKIKELINEIRECLKQSDK